MTPQDLIAAFDEVAESPDGVTRLRELVLQLAVRGKLVPQDPNDVPADELIGKAREERRRLVSQKAIRGKKMPPLAQDEIPYELPPTWTWTRIGNVAHDLGQGPPVSEFSYIDVSAIDKERGVIGDEVSVLAPEEAPSRARKHVKRGCVIYSTVRPYLRNIAVVDRDFAPEAIVSTAFSVLMPYDGIAARFLYYYLRSAVFTRFVEAHQKGIAYPAINDGDFQLGYVPVPPSAEQHRIVTKVDELMGLLDRLEAARNARETTRTALRDGALAALRDADTPEEVEVAWGRIAERMDELFIDPADVDPLRQTVLQLAVRGRLVPQDPNDEPATALLELVADEKARLVKEGKIRKPKPVPAPLEAEVPFKVPDGWACTLLATLVEGSGAGWSPKCPPNPTDSEADWGVLKTTAIQANQYLSQHHKALPSTLEPRPNIEVRQGDLLVTRAGPWFRVGVAAYVKETRPRLMLSDKIIRCPLVENGALGEWVAICINSGPGAEFLRAKQTGMDAAQMNISQSRLRSTPILLPPRTEQHRIVAQVEELTGLLDRLEARLADQSTAHEAFAAAAVHNLDS